MHDMAVLHSFLLVGALLFGIGMIGFLSRRNMIVMFISVEMMLQGVSLSFVAWGRYHNDWGGQILVIFILAVAACEAALALVLVLMLFQQAGDLDITFWQKVREAGQPMFLDEKTIEPTPPEKEWPHLAPAGVEPEHDPEETTHRSHV